MIVARNHQLLVMVMAVVALLAVGIPVAVHADMYWTFNNQAPGLIQPPWVFTTSNTSVIIGQVVSYQYAYAPPNAFEISVNPGTAYGNLTVPLNASSTTIAVGVVITVNSNSSDIPANDVLQITQNGHVVATFDLAQFYGAWHGVDGWLYANVGQNLTLGLSVVTNGNVGYDVYIGEVDVTGANIIQPATLFLVDAKTNQWFNIAAYPNAYIVVIYPSAVTPPSGWSKYGPDGIVLPAPQAPDLAIPGGAALVQVHVSGNYTATQLWSVSHTVYLFRASEVEPYLVQVNDLTGLFGPGSIIEISAGGRVLSSGYEGLDYTYSVWLPPGGYQITIISPNGASYSAPLFLGVSGVVPVSIENVTVSTSTYGSGISYGAGWNVTGTGIVAQYVDTTRTTSSLTISLLYTNATGTYTIAGTSFQGPLGTATAVFVANVNQSPYYTVLFTAQTPAGQMQFGPIPVVGGVVFPTALALPNQAFGLNYLLPASFSANELFAFAILATVAAVFGARGSRIGVVVVALLALLFYAAGWIPATTGMYALLYTIALLGMLALANYRRNRD